MRGNTRTSNGGERRVRRISIDDVDPDAAACAVLAPTQDIELFTELHSGERRPGRRAGLATMTRASHRFRPAVVALLLSGAPGVAAQQPAAPLTLQAAVDEAVASRPALKGAAAGQDAAAARLAEARAGRYPSVTFSERITNSNNPVFVFGTLLEQSRFAPENFGIDAFNAPNPTTNFRSQVDVRLPLFDGRQKATRSEQARLGRARDRIPNVSSRNMRVRFEVVQRVLRRARRRGRNGSHRTL